MTLFSGNAGDQAKMLVLLLLGGTVLTFCVQAVFEVLASLAKLALVLLALYLLYLAGGGRLGSWKELQDGLKDAYRYLATLLRDLLPPGTDPPTSD